jgi:hypothetical protein
MWPTPTTQQGGATVPDDATWKGRTTAYTPDGKKVQVNLKSAVKRWPTPTTKDDRPTSQASREKYGAGPTLGQAVREREMLPTPIASDADKMPSNSLSRLLKTGDKRGRMNPGNGGQLNPDWQDWLMGWPPGWSGLEPLGRDRFRLWLRLHGGCCQRTWDE